jgi:hypothetical protein
MTDPHLIDVELADLAARCARCVDLLAHCMTEIAAMDMRADVLLDQRNLDEIDRMV